MLDRVDRLATMELFEEFLAASGSWLGGFDFPFGLPREFAESLQLGDTTAAMIGELRRRCATRMAFRALVDQWGNGRPKGKKLLHRQTDRAMSGVTSSSPLQTRYVPVGFMYFEGVHRLVQAGVTIPRMLAGDEQRIAVEAYPGLLAFQLIGRRSYKNSNAADRLIARKDLVDALEQGRPFGTPRLKLSHAQREELVADPSGDTLDAVLCLVQAAWAAAQPGFGLPAQMDPLEGWIVSAPWPG